MTKFVIAAIVSCLLSSLAMAQTPHIQQQLDAQLAAQRGPIQGQAMAGCGSCAETAGGGCKGGCDSRFGLNPLIKRLMFWKQDTPCGSCGLKAGCFGKNCAGQGGYGQDFNPYPNGVPGTLVFPYNPYIRSPRDWYMTER
jgi:hypothetical protein